MEGVAYAGFPVDVCSLFEQIESITSAVEDLPFLGRKVEFQGLDNWLRHDELKVILISGDAGVGKSSLVKHWLAKRSSSAGWHRVTEYCDSSFDATKLFSLNYPFDSLTVFDECKNLDIRSLVLKLQNSKGVRAIVISREEIPLEQLPVASVYSMKLSGLPRECYEYVLRSIDQSIRNQLYSAIDTLNGMPPGNVKEWLFECATRLQREKARVTEEVKFRRGGSGEALPDLAAFAAGDCVQGASDENDEQNGWPSKLFSCLKKNGLVILGLVLALGSGCSAEMSSNRALRLDEDRNSRLERLIELEEENLRYHASILAKIDEIGRSDERLGFILDELAENDDVDQW